MYIRIIKAIQNTSKPLPNEGDEAMNIGILQTENAYDYLINNKDRIDQDISFEVSLITISKFIGIQRVYVDKHPE
jgi:hypothetical protein